MGSSSRPGATLPTPRTAMEMPPPRYWPQKPHWPGSWPSASAKMEEPPTTAARKAASLRTDGMPMLSGFFMPSILRSPSPIVRRMVRPV